MNERLGNVFEQSLLIGGTLRLIQVGLVPEACELSTEKCISPLLYISLSVFYSIFKPIIWR